ADEPPPDSHPRGRPVARRKPAGSTRQGSSARRTTWRPWRSTICRPATSPVGGGSVRPDRGSQEIAMIIPQLPPRRRIFRGIGLATAATVLGLAAALPVQADGATVTAGDVHAFATSSDSGIAGRATMVRTAAGTTIVIVQVEGLA